MSVYWNMGINLRQKKIRLSKKGTGVSLPSATTKKSKVTEPNNFLLMQNSYI